MTAREPKSAVEALAGRLTRVGKIPAGVLYFHAETWNEEKRKWQGRSACKNCSQWFDKIDAQRV
jgi:hypothetical protein